MECILMIMFSRFFFLIFALSLFLHLKDLSASDSDNILLKNLSPDERKELRLNVILITIDGFRTEEFFSGEDKKVYSSENWKIPMRLKTREDLMPYLWSELSKKATIIGNKKGDDQNNGRKIMRVSNIHRFSMPGYHSIFAGKKQKCDNNDCGFNPSETFLERVHHEVDSSENAVIMASSWERMKYSIQQKEGEILTSSGRLSSPLFSGNRAPIQTLKEICKKENDYRCDADTMNLSLKIISEKRPRLMVIGLGDTDEEAHAGNYLGYLNSIQQFDSFLMNLEMTLKMDKDYYNRTAIIITTDHGRGTGKQWRSHDFFKFGSGRVWMVVKAPPLLEEKTTFNLFSKNKKFRHKDIKPLVEYFFGLD